MTAASSSPRHHGHTYRATARMKKANQLGGNYTLYIQVEQVP